jgi:CRISPR/Cas system CSM-associated protein Csm5 (group 7 of RAMP superfamily)
MITAPYNFVPLNKEIFYPSWADDVSHDVPFEDAESGEIDITITAKSPIFIRDSKDEEEFCQHNNEYYIPSSSVKGMLRNVLEIMSFSKMRLETFDDDTYAVRDLRNPTLYMTKYNILWLAQIRYG